MADMCHDLDEATEYLPVDRAKVQGLSKDVNGLNYHLKWP